MFGSTRNFKRKQKRESAGNFQSRRSLFDAKRRNYLEEYNPEESPTKYLIINSASSDDDHTPLTPKLRANQIDPVLGTPADIDIVEGLICDSPNQKLHNISLYDSDDDECASNVTEIYPSTPVTTRNLDLEITEFTTPQKEHDLSENDSSPKTPLLRPRRKDHDLDISEYMSPAKRIPDDGFSDNETCAESADIPTPEETDDESNLDNPTARASKSRTKSFTQKKRDIKKLPAEFAYSIEDGNSLSLVVLKSYRLDNADGHIDGILVWTLCYDVINEIERYIIFIQRPGKSIKTGICIRLFPPWQVSFVPTVDGEVIHSVHLYQIILHSLLNITTEKIREVVNKSSSSVSYSKFHWSIPGLNGLQILKFIPQLQHSEHTIMRQADVCRTSIDINAMVWLKFSFPDCIHILVRDYNLTFAIIEISNDWFDGHVNLNVFSSFKNLAFGERITHYTYASLFSVLRKLGSSQETYYKLLWRPGSTLSELEISPVPAPVIPEVCTPLAELKKTVREDSRVSVKGIIHVLTNSELTIYEAGTLIRINLLKSFRAKELIELTDVGRMIEISLLRVASQNVYTLDQYSNAKFANDVRYSLRATQRSSSQHSTPQLVE